QTANRVLDLVGMPNKFLAVLDERAVFSHGVTRYMDRGKLPHHRHSGQLERVVLVRLAFDVLPPPGFVVRAAEQRLEPQFQAEVVDPSARPAGFHHNQIDLVVFEDCREILPRRRRRLKSILLRVGFVKAAHRVEFPKVDCENVHDQAPWFWGCHCDTLLRVTGMESE
ncbi:hypothetical protein LCGC14_2797020, partial [marine sediment metagenome]